MTMLFHAVLVFLALGVLYTIIDRLTWTPATPDEQSPTIGYYIEDTLFWPYYLAHKAIPSLPSFSPITGF